MSSVVSVLEGAVPAPEVIASRAAAEAISSSVLERRLLDDAEVRNQQVAESDASFGSGGVCAGGNTDLANPSGYTSEAMLITRIQRWGNSGEATWESSGSNLEEVLSILDACIY